MVGSRPVGSGSGRCAWIWWRLRAVFVLDDVSGLGEIGNDAIGGVLGDARPGRDVAQPHARVVGDAQQHPGVAGQEAPVRYSRKLW